MGYVYKFTHKHTGKWYVGSHNGKNENYHGSGLMWVKAVKKYGIDSFHKDILYEGELYREKEDEILKELDAANDPMSYNIKNEAIGGSFPGEKNGMFGKKLTAEQRYKCGSGFRGKTRPEHSIKMRGSNNPMYGRSDHAKNAVILAKKNTGKTYDEIFGIEKSRSIRKKQSETQLGKKHNLSKVKCPHCVLIGSGPNMTRYHFDKCLLNLKNDQNQIGSFSVFPRIDNRKKTFMCPYCGKEGQNEGNMKRWHFENCKVK